MPYGLELKEIEMSGRRLKGIPSPFGLPHTGIGPGSYFNIYVMERRRTREDVSDWVARTVKARKADRLCLAAGHEVISVVLGAFLATRCQSEPPSPVDAYGELLGGPRLNMHSYSFASRTFVISAVQGLRAAEDVLADLMPCELARLDDGLVPTITAEGGWCYGMTVVELKDAVKVIAEHLEEMSLAMSDDDLVCFDGQQ